MRQFILTAAAIGCWLAAPAARAVAYKTGTSYGFRDAWSIGVSADWTVGVWVGRPDGMPRPGENPAWLPPSPGFFRITAIEQLGAMASETVQVR